MKTKKTGPRPGPRPGPRDQDKFNRAKILIDRGYSKSNVSAILGVSVPTLTRWSRSEAWRQVVDPDSEETTGGKPSSDDDEKDSRDDDEKDSRAKAEITETLINVLTAPQLKNLSIAIEEGTLHEVDSELLDVAEQICRRHDDYSPLKYFAWLLRRGRDGGGRSQDG